MPQKNYGLLPEPIPHDIGYVGGIGDVLPDILPSGDWEPYLPAFEAQSKLGLETMNCVQFSRLNACEIMANFYGKPINKSDRFLYWASGCTERGNTFSACDYGLRKFGCCDEDLWAWNEALTRAQYGMAPPQDVQDKAAKLFDEWHLGMLVWVPNTVEAMRAALKKGPLWFCNSGHAMVIYRIDDAIRVFDTYGNGKGQFPLAYAPQIVAAYNAPFTPKAQPNPQPPMQFQENTLIQIVEGKGGFLLAAAGKLYLDDISKILASWLVRTGGKIEGKVLAVKLSDIAGVQLYNLKNEPVDL